MKALRLLPCLLLMIVCFYLSGCASCDQQVHWTLDPGGKIHIFASTDEAAKAGLPTTAITYTIASRTDSISQSIVSWRSCTGRMVNLQGTIHYEYHAGSRNNAASLEFVIKDPNQNKVLWQGRQTFRPTKIKAEIEESFDLPINLDVDGSAIPQVTIEAIPRSAGDFGFFIYDLSGTLNVE